MQKSFTTSSIQQLDKELIWHPYTQHFLYPENLPIAKANGEFLIDTEGNQYIDAISSWWTNIHGHSHPYIAEKIYQQAKTLEHVMFAGFTHQPAVELATMLLKILPNHYQKIFYSDNGSTAVEVALKMAIQYFTNQKITNRKKIICLSNSYHGDTFGAMSIGEKGIFTLHFHDFLFDVVQIATDEDWQEQIINPEEICCFIYEPLVQGAGGMLMYQASWLDGLLEFCHQHHIITIADEVMTGFGRTGKLFASEYLHHKADIICLSKGITGGTLALGATVCTQKIYDCFLSSSLENTLFHGHSFTANPLACAAAIASIELLLKEKCLKKIEWLCNSNKNFIEKWNEPKIKNLRCCGTIVAFELCSAKSDYSNDIKKKLIEYSLQQGVVLRPLGNTVYIMPPYCIGEDELTKIYSCLKSLPEIF